MERGPGDQRDPMTVAQTRGACIHNRENSGGFCGKNAEIWRAESCASQEAPQSSMTFFLKTRTDSSRELSLRCAAMTFRLIAP